ncbi:RNA-binding domain-containing protein [Xylariaceae sp. FL0255]|nr:RNA-binding domain-containing protein [Xylariaceae sp. FL0255]
MHSIRRAALVAATSASRFVAVPRQQIGFAAAHLSKASKQPVATLPLSRHFSQTLSARQEQEDPVSAAIRGEGEAAPAAAAGEQTPSVFISNMTFDATDVHLREAFSKYGEVTATQIGRDGRGLSRGFGFVHFATKEAADRAVNEANKSFWHGRRILVQHRESNKNLSERAPRDASAPSKSLYIGNIPYETSDADLNKLFRSLENVKDVRVAVDRNTGWPRGFAHADFDDLESAIKAHEILSQTMMGGRQLRCDYSQRNPNRRDNQ